MSRNCHIIGWICAALLLLPGLAASGQNTRTQESKKARLEKEIRIIDNQLSANASKSKSATGDLNLIRKKISNREEILLESEQELAEINARVESKQQEVDALQERLDTLSGYYGKLVQNAYKNRDAKVWYMYILASENLGQAFRRIGYLKSLSSQMKVQARKITKTKEELEVEKEALLQMKQQAEQIHRARQAEMRALRSEESQVESLISRLKKDRTKYQRELSEKKKQVERLNREIARIIREATGNVAKRSSKGSTKSKTAIDYTLDAEFAKNKGKLPWPADGPVVEKYGQRNHPVFSNVQLPFNNGITLAVQPDTPVKAIFDGVVKNIGVIPGYNQCILIQHGNYFSLYCKMGKVSVKAGDKVKTGQGLGTVGVVDGQTQLHLQIWKGSTPQNPEIWLQ